MAVDRAGNIFIGEFTTRRIRKIDVNGIITTFAGGGIYSATKHAVHAFSGCLFDDLRDRGMKVSAIYPGFVDTGMTAGVEGDRSHMIQPDDVACALQFVLEFPSNACPTEIVIRPQFPL